MTKVETYTVPLRLLSEGNKRDHWTKKAKRNTVIKLAVKAIMASSVIKPPCLVILTRIAPRELDEDNLHMSLKHVKDTVASLLVPNLAPGRADGDKRIQWQIKQEYGGVRYYALKIELVKNED